MSETKNAYFLSGPKGQCVVWGSEAIEPAIKMLAELYDDLAEDYTATLLSKVYVNFHEQSVVR